MNRDLHLVSFDIPSPPDYGGVYLVYHTIRALSELGIKVHLHAFTYNERKIDQRLRNYCNSIHIYPRKTGFSAQLNRKPYIVFSRRCPELLQRLKTQKYPILFEGLHCAYYLNHDSLAQHKKVVRLHNIEWQYYGQLAKHSNRLYEQLFFRMESLKLKRFEQEDLAPANHLITINEEETEYFKSTYNNVSFVPAIHGFEQIESKIGIGEYVLFHGNLSVEENASKAIELIRAIGPSENINLIIAGKGPGPRLKSMVNQYSNCDLHADVSDEEMADLILNAHCHVVLSSKRAGIKLKLLHALFRGRWVIADEASVQGSRLDEAVLTLYSISEILGKIEGLIGKPFTEKDINYRRSILSEGYNNAENTRKLATILLDHDATA